MNTGEKQLLADDHPQVVYVANHQAILDPLVMGAVWPERTGLVVKKSLKYVPLFGFIVWALGNLFVNRGSRKQSVGVMLEAANMVSAHILCSLFLRRVDLN
jgi:1-acyl-sn-glycerol-3-phosphate acyltransferase